MALISSRKKIEYPALSNQYFFVRVGKNPMKRPANFKKGNPLKIIVVAPEVAPYATVGGFSRVTASLSRALINLGHDVRLFMPKFGSIDEKKYPTQMLYEGMKVPTGDETKPELICNVKNYQPKPGTGAQVYFLENMEYYEQRANVYGYSDDPIRWALFARGLLEFLRLSEWQPDIIHANDWHTGSVPNLLRTIYLADPKLAEIATLFTIHNLNFQGMFDHRNVSELDADDGRSAIASFFSPRLPKQNFMRRGILYADAVNTVSETYAREILTPEFGEGLDRLLQEVRSKLFGVVNGIDYDEYNPTTDRLIPVNYDVSSLHKRVEDKKELQKEFGLPVDPDTPILAIEGRLDKQKGLDLTLEIIRPLLRNFEVQFIALGGGDPEIADAFRKLKEDFPKQVGIHLMPNFTLPRLIFAGADIMLFPSKFEPCGIVQMEGMRYGAISVARAVGGLADTIENFDPRRNTGYGFTFKDYDKWQFFAQVVRALEAYNHKDTWRGLKKRAMTQDYSWEASALRYIDLYEKAILFHQTVVENG